MTQPAVIASKKAVITQRSALISTLRTWFFYRDNALWAFVGGTEAERPVEEIVIDDKTTERILEANKSMRAAWVIAEQIAQESDQKAATIMREAVNDLLAAERPRFLLSVEHIAGSF